MKQQEREAARRASIADGGMSPMQRSDPVPPNEPKSVFAEVLAPHQREEIPPPRAARIVLWNPARSVVTDEVTTTGGTSVSVLFMATYTD